MRETEAKHTRKRRHRDMGDETKTVTWGRAIKIERDKEKQRLEPLYREEEEQSPPQQPPSIFCHLNSPPTTANTLFHSR
jgi:hypothetical protein